MKVLVGACGTEFADMAKAFEHIEGDDVCDDCCSFGGAFHVIDNGEAEVEPLAEWEADPDVLLALLSEPKMGDTVRVTVTGVVGRLLLPTMGSSGPIVYKIDTAPEHNPEGGQWVNVQDCDPRVTIVVTKRKEG